MDEEKMISDMRKVLLDYCITDLRSNNAALNGHKDDYTFAHRFFFGVYEEAMSKASQRILTAENEKKLAKLALYMNDTLKADLCTRYNEDSEFGHCWSYQFSPTTPKYHNLCPAWDKKSMSCMLDKQEALFRKKR